MRTRRLLIFALGVLVVVAFGVLWVYPAVAGPSVDCGENEPAACDALWRQAVADTSGGTWLPVTAIRVDEADASGCGSVRIDRWIFAAVTIYDCL